MIESNGALGKDIQMLCVNLQRSELYKQQYSCNTQWGSESWILKEQDRESFEIVLLEKTPENTIDGQENKQMDY